MKPKTVGTYDIGYIPVKIILTDGANGASFYNPSEISTIEIGGDQEWMSILDTLLHEIYEFQYDKMQCRYSANENMSDTHDKYLFVFNHIQFSDSCAKVGEFMAVALPDLLSAWKAWRKKSKTA
jgi:hypothetical protein